MNEDIIGGILLLLFGVLSLIAGVVLLRRHLKLLMRAKRGSATVVDYEDSWGHDYDGNRVRYYTRVVQFTNKNGELVTARENVSRLNKQLHQRVKVLYYKDGDQHIIHQPSLWSDVLFPVLILFAGIFGLVTGGALLLGIPLD